LTRALEAHENAATRRERRHAPPDQIARAAAAPAPPAAAQLLLAVQRGAGNQAAGRLARRRQQPARTLDPPFGVGAITANDFAVTIEVNAERQLGDGYETEQEAAVAAASTGRIGVVVADAEGRLRAYATDMVPFDTPAHTAPAVLPVGRVVRFARVSATQDPLGWSLRQAYIAALDDSGEAERKRLARQMLVNLLIGEVGLRPDDVHDSTDAPPELGKVNVNIEYKDARGHAGEAGPIPSDRTTPLERPVLEIGPHAFADPISLRGTIHHEFEHLHHTERAIEAVERWRATEPKLEFMAWLNKQRDAGKVSPVDHGLIREQVSKGTQATEAMAYMRGFVETFHLRALDSPELFTSLNHFAGEWTMAGHAVQDETVAQLQAYRETLDGEHRAALDAFIDARRGETLWDRFP
jgi:hypothetical protein